MLDAVFAAVAVGVLLSSWDLRRVGRSHSTLDSRCGRLATGPCLCRASDVPQLLRSTAFGSFGGIAQRVRWARKRV